MAMLLCFALSAAAQQLKPWRGGAAAKARQARALPASFLIGVDGRIRYSVLGGIDWTAERVRKAIVEFLPPRSPGMTPP